MKEGCLAAALLLVIVLSGGSIHVSNGYGAVLIPSIWGNTQIAWRVVDCPATPFSLYWSGNGYWLAQPNSTMTLTILAVTEDIEGTITLGNRTWNANDTDIAKDLALGVWGFTPWLPGLIVKIGQQDFDELNKTAYDSADRVPGNFLNGTMISYYSTVTAGGVAHNCLVFDYQQDNTSFGEPQRTYLAYDTGTGLLVRGNTTYSFGTPYELSVELASVYAPSSVVPLVIVGLSLGVTVIMVLILLRRRR
jgi:hypothetical protein